MSEAPHIVALRGWLIPRGTAKTICLVAQRAPDPFAIGSVREADTATCHEILSDGSRMPALDLQPFFEEYQRQVGE